MCSYFFNHGNASCTFLKNNFSLSNIRQMQNQAKRFEALIKSLKTNQLQLSKKIGVQYSQTNSILHGRSKISRGYLEKLLHIYPKINSHWLLTGEGPMYLEPNNTSTQIVEEPNSEYVNKSIFNVLPLDDKPIRKQLGNNISRLISAWGMKKNEFWPILVPGVQKQTVTNYTSGSSQPPLFALVHLERITGISLVDWLTNDIPAAQMPDGPQSGALIRGSGEIGALIAEIKTVLERYG